MGDRGCGGEGVGVGHRPGRLDRRCRQNTIRLGRFDAQACREIADSLPCLLLAISTRQYVRHFAEVDPAHQASPGCNDVGDLVGAMVVC